MTAPTLPRPGTALLSDADRDLIRMLAEGMSAKQIASRIGIATTAAAQRVISLRTKTGTSTSAHLVATALRCGWLDDAPAWRAAA